MNIIWRSDDIGYSHIAHAGEIIMNEEFILEKLSIANDLFKKYGVCHTIAIIAKDLNKANALISYIKENRNIDVQLHCYTHEDFTTLSKQQIQSQINMGLLEIKKCLGVDCKIFYPPYNKVNDLVIKTVNEMGLKVSFLKMSLSNYLNGYDNSVINFHVWSDECRDLENALKKYTNNA